MHEAQKLELCPGKSVFVLTNRTNTFDRFVFPAIGGALFGYDIGATSGAVISLKVGHR